MFNSVSVLLGMRETWFLQWGLSSKEALSLPCEWITRLLINLSTNAIQKTADMESNSGANTEWQHRKVNVCVHVCSYDSIQNSQMSAEVSQSISYLKKASEDIKKKSKIVSLMFLYQIPVCHKSFHIQKLEMGLLQQWIVFAGGCSICFCAVSFSTTTPRANTVHAASYRS